MLTLWSNRQSSNAMKVRFMLAELELDYELEEVSLANPRPAEYLAINPMGGIPTLRDDEFVLAESQAILRYLAGREERTDLYPSDPRERGLVDQFLDRFTTRLRPALFRHEALALGWSLERGFDPQAADPGAARALEPEMERSLELLDRFAGSDFTVLGRLTIADFALAPVLHRTRATGLDLAGRVKLLSLRERVLERGSWLACDPQ